MEPTSNHYHLSFFKPTTPQARANRNMVILFVCIWAVAIFGFQIALKVLGKPTPEQGYLTFEQVWGNIRSGNANNQDIRAFAQVSLSVLGKNFIAPEHRAALDNALSWSLYQLSGEADRENIMNGIREFEKLKSSTGDLTSPEYVRSRDRLAGMAAPVLGLSSSDARTRIIAIELSSEGVSELKDATLRILPACMSLYLIHNQSFLTDVRFLGFPFHYFYTAIFLLILFVGLCWMYCYRLDRIHIRHHVND